jgi:copper chaperone CopZ
MKYLMMVMGLMLVSSMQAQEETKKQDELAYMVVKSTTVCGMCKETIETELPFEKGVKKATVNLETSEIGVDFNPNKTDKEKIRVAISQLGYQADHLPADPKAFEKLPACCQKEGCGQRLDKAEEPEHKHEEGEEHGDD